MATRRQRLLLLLVPGLLAAPLAAARAAPGEAQATRQARARERAALLQSLPQGAPFRSGGESWRVVGGLQAVPRPPAGGAEGLAAAAPVGVVEEKGPYRIVRQVGAAPLAAPLAAPAAAGALAVAVNVRTNAFGVVLGTIDVRLRDRNAGAALARDLGLELVAATPGISMAFFRVPPGGDLQSAAERLARDARVRSAEIEVKESFDLPM